MTITRVINGKEEIIELTPAEMRLASKAYEEECHKEDIEGKIKEILVEPFTLVTDDANAIVFKCGNKEKEFAENTIPLLDKSLGHNDSYWESFWLSVEDVINEEMSVVAKDSTVDPKRISATIADDKVRIRILLDEEVVAKYEDGEIEVYNFEFFASKENRLRVCDIISWLWF